MRLVSVVVPIYNVEKYLRRCLDSIRGQTYQNIEILLIDDGSTDTCPIICDEYAKLDSRFQVVHQKNIGLGGARNRGLIDATGEYILFVDSDDWIEKDCIETYMLKATEKGYDFVASNSFYEVSDDKKVIRYTLPEGEYSSQEKIEILLIDGLVSMCMKLFRRTWLLENELFQPPIYTYEDWGTYSNMISKANKIYVFNQPYYYYTLAREGCITTGSETKLILGFEQSLYFMLRFIKNNGLWEKERQRLRFYCLKDYYARLQINQESRNLEAKAILDRINTNILLKEFGKFNLDEKRYLVLGSFSLRWEVQKGCLLWEKVNQHFCFSSIISIFSSKWERKVTHKNTFRRQQIEKELQSNLLAVIEQVDEHTIFFIDFLEERYDLLEVEPDIYVTESEAFGESNLKDIKYIRRIKNDTKEYMELWVKACDSFVNLLKKNMKRNQIIIVKNRMSLTYGDFSHKSTFKNVVELTRINQRVKQMEDYFCMQISDTIVVNGDQEYFFADPNLPYGCRPEYANNAWYAKVGYELFNKIV